MATQSMSLIEAHRRMTEFLERRGIDQPRLCSEIITAKALGLRRIDVYAQHDRPVNGLELDTMRDMGKRLAGGEPLQIVVGDCQFFSYMFKMKKGVFIPRPETETLVETAAKMLKERAIPAPRALDLCCGCGAIIITLLKFMPELSGAGVDISQLAAGLARENAETLGVSNRLDIYDGDLFGPLPVGSKFDVITSNPPYIPTHDILIIEPIVRDNDPNASLDGGADGLDTVRRIAAGAPEFLSGGGLLAFEIGMGQAAKTEDILKNNGFSETAIHLDLSGMERVVTGCLK